jgi:hypothetical protein
LLEIDILNLQARTKLNNIEFGNNYPPSITKYYEAEKRFYYLIYSIE